MIREKNTSTIQNLVRLLVTMINQRPLNQIKYTLLFGFTRWPNVKEGVPTKSIKDPWIKLSTHSFSDLRAGQTSKKEFQLNSQNCRKVDLKTLLFPVVSPLQLDKFLDETEKNHGVSRMEKVGQKEFSRRLKKRYYLKGPASTTYEILDTDKYPLVLPFII